MSEGKAPIQNLMDGTPCPATELFKLPGTNLTVSVARVSPTEKHKTVMESFMVYIRDADKHNIGYLHVNVDTGEVEWSCSGLKL